MDEVSSLVWSSEHRMAQTERFTNAIFINRCIHFVPHYISVCESFQVWFGIFFIRLGFHFLTSLRLVISYGILKANCFRSFTHSILKLFIIRIRKSVIWIFKKRLAASFSISKDIILSLGYFLCLRLLEDFPIYCELGSNWSKRDAVVLKGTTMGLTKNKHRQKHEAQITNGPRVLRLLELPRGSRVKNLPASRKTEVSQSCWLFATSWTVTCQPPLSMGFSRQEYWSE